MDVSPVGPAVQVVLAASQHTDIGGAVATARLSEPQFVGRGPEIAELTRAWDEARQGAARVVGVGGAAGIGKTAVIRRFLQDARPDTVIRVSGDAAEATLPWGLSTQLTPEVRRGAPAADPSATVHAAAQALVDHLRSIGRGVLVVEDAHWADHLSMTALRLAVRRLGTEPVLVVVVYQPVSGRDSVVTGTPVPGLDDAWRRVFDSERGRHLSITGLPAADLVRLAAASGHRGLAPAGAARLYEHTGGHPVHVRHLLDELPMHAIIHGVGVLPAPRAITTALLPRLYQCRQETRDLVAAGAVLGCRFRPADVRALLDTACLGGAVTEAVRAGLIEEVPGSVGHQLAFTSSLVRGAVYHEIDGTTRRELHRRAAPRSATGRIWHRIAAADGPDPTLAADTELEARACLDRGQLSRATVYLRHALDLTPPGPARGPRLLTLVESLLVAGDVAEALEHSEELAQLGPDPWSDYVAGYQLLLLGQIADAKQRLDRALIAGWRQPQADADQLVLDRRPADLQARIATQLAIIGVLTLSHPEMVHHAAVAVAAAREPWVAALAAFARALGLTISGRCAQALAELSGADAPGAPSGLDGLMARGMIRLWTDDLDGAERDLRDTVARAARGEQLGNGQALGFLGEVRYRQGALADAVRHTEAAIAEAEDNNRVWNLAMLHALASYPLAAQGRFTQAWHHIEQAGTWARAVATPTAMAYVAVGRATIAQARGDASALLAAADELERAYPAGEPGTHLLAAARADALSRLGEVGEAKRVLAAFEAKVAAVGRRSAQLSIARVRGQIAAAEQRYADALAECRTAQQLAYEIGLPIEVGRIELQIGEYTAASGRRAAAHRSLRAALRQFAGLGADAYVAQTRAAAERMGLSLDTAPAALGALTPAERAVAVLVGRGMSNREVAQRLFLSLKTIEFHLTNAFRRLDISTRAELRHLMTDVA